MKRPLARLACCASVVIVVCVVTVGGEPPEQRVAKDCCRDLGLLQQAVIDAMNKTASDIDAARAISQRALEATGLTCKWEGELGGQRGGATRLVCK